MTNSLRNVRAFPARFPLFACLDSSSSGIEHSCKQIRKFKSVFFFLWRFVNDDEFTYDGHCLSRIVFTIVEIVQWRLLESQFYSLDLSTFFGSTRPINVETNDRIHSRESLICRQRKLLEQRRTMLRNYGYCIQDDANSSPRILSQSKFRTSIIFKPVSRLISL